jgi:chemotaxis protein CheX
VNGLDYQKVMEKVGENVLGGYLGLGTTIMTPEELHTQSLRSKGLGVIIQVVGELEGQVICSMEMETARSIVGRMMGGAAVSEMDELGWSAFQEFGNWIVSGIATQLSEQGIVVNITHPLIQEGDFIVHMNKKMTPINIITDIGQLDMYITLTS